MMEFTLSLLWMALLMAAVGATPVDIPPTNQEQRARARAVLQPERVAAGDRTQATAASTSRLLTSEAVRQRVESLRKTQKTSHPVKVENEKQFTQSTNQHTIKPTPPVVNPEYYVYKPTPPTNNAQRYLLLPLSNQPNYMNYPYHQPMDSPYAYSYPSPYYHPKGFFQDVGNVMAGLLPIEINVPDFFGGVTSIVGNAVSRIPFIQRWREQAANRPRFYLVAIPQSGHRIQSNPFQSETNPNNIPSLKMFLNRYLNQMEMHSRNPIQMNFQSQENLDDDFTDPNLEEMYYRNVNDNNRGMFFEHSHGIPDSFRQSPIYSWPYLETSPMGRSLSEKHIKNEEKNSQINANKEDTKITVIRNVNKQ